MVSIGTLVPTFEVSNFEDAKFGDFHIGLIQLSPTYALFTIIVKNRNPCQNLFHERSKVFAEIFVEKIESYAQTKFFEIF